MIETSVNQDLPVEARARPSAANIGGAAVNGPVQLRLPMQRKRVLGRVEMRAAAPTPGWKRRLAKPLVALVALAGLWFASDYVQQWARSSELFALSQVHVEGNERASREELMRYLNVQPGDNLVGLPLEALRANVLRHPWIKTAGLRRELPRKLVLEVTEHEARGMVALPALYLVDDDGEVFARATPDAAAEHVAITGLSTELYEHDRAEWNRLLSLAFSFVDAARESELTLGEVHVDDALGVTAYLLPNGVPASFGYGDFLGKITRLKKTRALLLRDGQHVESFLLDNERHPEWVVARVTKPVTQAGTATFAAAR